MGHVHTALGRKGALDTVRREGIRLTRYAFAIRIGRAGYYAALAKAFKS